MKGRFLAVACTVLACAALSCAAGQPATAADTTIFSLDERYSERALAAICALENGLAYHSGEGRYGCTNGVNNVECHDDATCTAFIGAPFAVTGGAGVGAEGVLQMPIAPGGNKVSRSMETTEE
jgi:hypothetical protein